MRKVVSKQPEYDYNKIGVTALMVAHLRSFSNMPYAKDIDNLIGAGKTWRKIEGDNAIMRIMELAPGIEARGISINNILRNENAMQILELASGMSPRGLQFTEDLSVTYVETDLQPMATQKRSIVRRISGDSQRRGRHYILDADAMSYADLSDVSGVFLNKPLYIVSEGLLNHLNGEERSLVAHNVRCLLGVFGGAWILSDIEDKERIMRRPDSGRNNSVMKLTGRNIFDNVPSNQEETRKEFESAGFTVEKLPIFSDLSKISSFRSLNINKEDINPLIQKSHWQYTWILRLRN